jgi:hypothetical protein
MGKVPYHINAASVQNRSFVIVGPRFRGGTTAMDDWKTVRWTQVIASTVGTDKPRTDRDSGARAYEMQIDECCPDS